MIEQKPPMHDCLKRCMYCSYWFEYKIPEKDFDEKRRFCCNRCLLHRNLISFDN